jgi:hypothetical protein
MVSGDFERFRDIPFSDRILLKGISLSLPLGKREGRDIPDPTPKGIKGIVGDARKGILR